MIVTRSLLIDDLTPEEAANIFLREGDEWQAAFFNAFKSITDTWPGAGWCQQSYAIAQHLDRSGAETIAKLAEWAADPTGENA